MIHKEKWLGHARKYANTPADEISPPAPLPGPRKIDKPPLDLDRSCGARPPARGQPAAPAGCPFADSHIEAPALASPTADRAGPRRPAACAGSPRRASRPRGPAEGGRGPATLRRRRGPRGARPGAAPARRHRVPGRRGGAGRALRRAGWGAGGSKAAPSGELPARAGGNQGGPAGCQRSQPFLFLHRPPRHARLDAPVQPPQFSF